MVHPALPADKATLLHTAVTPSRNVTVPVGDTPVTLAVMLTL